MKINVTSSIIAPIASAAKTALLLVPKTMGIGPMKITPPLSAVPPLATKISTPMKVMMNPAIIRVEPKENS